MKNGSMIEVAEKILTENGTQMSFVDLWAKVKEALDITPEEEVERVGFFYTDLSLARSTFVVLTDNYVDLRSRLKYEKYRTPYQETETEDELEGQDEIDKKEEAEYNKSVNGGLYDGGTSDTGATDGEGLEDTGKDINVNDYIHSGNINPGEDY